MHFRPSSSQSGNECYDYTIEDARLIPYDLLFILKDAHSTTPSYSTEISCFTPFAVEEKNPLGEQVPLVSETIRRLTTSQAAAEPKNPIEIPLTSNHDGHLNFEILLKDINLRKLFCFFKILLDFAKTILKQIIANLLLVNQGDLIKTQISSVELAENRSLLLIVPRFNLRNKVCWYK